MKNKVEMGYGQIWEEEMGNKYNKDPASAGKRNCRGDVE